jgi:hypothetical protein
MEGSDPELIADLRQLVKAYDDFIKSLKPREPECLDFVLYRQIDPETGVTKFFTVEKYAWTEALPFNN